MLGVYSSIYPHKTSLKIPHQVIKTKGGMLPVAVQGDLNTSLEQDKGEATAPGIYLFT